EQQVEEHEVVGDGRHLFERGHGVIRAVDVEAAASQGPAEKRRDSRFVLDDQASPHHLPLPPTFSSRVRPPPQRTRPQRVCSIQESPTRSTLATPPLVSPVGALVFLSLSPVGASVFLSLRVGSYLSSGLPSSAERHEFPMAPIVVLSMTVDVS